MERKNLPKTVEMFVRGAIAGAILTVPALLDFKTAYASPPFDQEIALTPPGYRPTDMSWEGIASYYSRAGCLGCSWNMLMANGEPLDDEAPTLAFMRAPLNSWVLVENIENGLASMARITDRGGFEPYGRIADLSLGLRYAIGGEDLTQVRITLLQEVEPPQRIDPPIPHCRETYLTTPDNL